MRATFIREDGTAFTADFSEQAIKSTKKETWVRDMLKVYGRKGVDEGELKVKLSEVYDLVKGKKSKETK